MKNLMMNIEWEYVKCHICNKNVEPEVIMLKDKPLVDGQFGYSIHPVICPSCGLVYLNPRWSKKDYDVFYSHYYDPLYRLEIKPDYGVKGVIKNMKVIYDRIKNYISNDTKNILDAGCGSGYGLRYLHNKMPNSEVYGIESSPECCKFLQSDEIGAKLVTTDFDSGWTENYKNKFDLVILRHVIEHMLDPVNTLKKRKNVLTKDGFIYFATPDMMHPRIELRDYDKWWEYWFRVVHPYYYCKETMFKTLEIAGLYPYRFGDKEKEEVWALAKKQKTMDYNFETAYEKQKRLLNILLH